MSDAVDNRAQPAYLKLVTPTYDVSNRLVSSVTTNTLDATKRLVSSSREGVAVQPVYNGVGDRVRQMV